MDARRSSWAAPVSGQRGASPDKHAVTPKHAIPIMQIYALSKYHMATSLFFFFSSFFSLARPCRCGNYNVAMGGTEQRLLDKLSI